MDIIELTKKAVELANQDTELKEKIKDTVVTITMVLKNATAERAEESKERKEIATAEHVDNVTVKDAEKEKEQAITISVDRGELKLITGEVENPDFQFEISKEDFTKLMTGKAYGMILMATKKLKMVKGTWAEINKIVTPLSAIPKFGKQIASNTD